MIEIQINYHFTCRICAKQKQVDTKKREVGISVLTREEYPEAIAPSGWTVLLGMADAICSESCWMQYAREFQEEKFFEFVQENNPYKK